MMELLSYRNDTNDAIYITSPHQWKVRDYHLQTVPVRGEWEWMEVMHGAE